VWSGDGGAWHNPGAQCTTHTSHSRVTVGAMLRGRLRPGKGAALPHSLPVDLECELWMALAVAASGEHTIRWVCKVAGHRVGPLAV